MEIENADWLAQHVEEKTIQEKPASMERDETGFRDFVEQLKVAMSFDPAKSDKILGEIESEKGSFENNVGAWVAMVDEDRGVLENLQGKIKINYRGKEVVRTIIPDKFTKRAGDINENCSNSSKLLSLALATAKLELVRDLATDVYPALETDFDKSFAYLEEIKKNVTGQNAEVKLQENASLREALTMKVPKRLLVPLMATAVITTILLSGCGGNKPESAFATSTIESPIAETSGVPVQTEAPIAVEKATAPNHITTDSKVSVIWSNGYADMELDGESVRMPTEGFVYTSDAPNGVRMSRENISVTVDSVEVEFKASGVGDSLDLVVTYTSAGNESSFELGDDGESLSLSNASEPQP